MNFSNFTAFLGKNKLNVIIGLIVLLLIWFVLPHIPMGSGYPFQSAGARFSIVGIFVLLAILKQVGQFVMKHKGKTFSVLGAGWNKTKNFTKRTASRGSHKSKQRWRLLMYRLKEGRRSRQLRKLPWYMVIGEKESGKKTFIQNTELSFVRPENFGEEAIQYINRVPDYGWWFSERAVFIDAPLQADAEQETSALKRFVRLLKSQRRSKPLNGVIITYSLADLITATNQKRQEMVQNICQKIRALHHHFKYQVPVYLIFNKCDLIDGFMEFFSDLSKEELRQIWGMTLPLSQCNNVQAVQGFFHKEYQAMLQQLRNRVMWAMDTERSERGRELIHAFPQQMLLFKKPLENFINEIFGATRYPRAIQMRGMYFTSCLQGQSAPIDFVMKAMSKKFQLVPPRFERIPRIGEHYFVRNLFRTVIYPEAPILGDSESRKRRRHFAYLMGLIACPIAVIVASFSMYAGYRANSEVLGQVQADLNTYSTQLSKVKPSSMAITPLLDTLNPLNQALSLYRDSASWKMHTLWETSSIESSLHDTLVRTLQSLFIPRVAAQLENSLNANIHNQNVLYATLKSYLAFSPTSSVSSDAIKAPMEYQWSHNNSKADAQQLRYYLNLALAKPVAKLPLDQGLIDRTRSQLAEIVPAQRAFGLIKLHAGVSNYPDVLISAQVGTEFAEVFNADKSKLTVPALYTGAGYANIFAPQHQSISAEVASDNHDIGIANTSSAQQTSAEINSAVETHYNKNYLAHWSSALASINTKSFTTYAAAIKQLSLITDKQSPFVKLLKLIDKNTSNVSVGNVKVADHYAALRAYIRNDGSGATWSDTQTALQNILAYFKKMHASKNPNQAAYKAVLATLAGQSSPLYALSKQADMAPQPIKRWLTSLSKDCWQLLVIRAHAAMNTAWNKTVAPEYNNGISGRYPLNRHAYSQVSLADFNRFFAPKGVLNQYFTQYIKPFIQVKDGKWTARSIHGLSIELPQHNIDLFKRAQVIGKTYFADGAKQASFNFTVRPLALDGDASSIQLTFGDKTLTYSHGPQNVANAHWPLPASDDGTAVNITDFNSNQFGRSAAGPWAIFKLFDYGHLREASHNGTYYLNFNFGSHHAAYRITGPSNMDAFKLTSLKGFALPSEIAPNPKAEK